MVFQSIVMTTFIIVLIIALTIIGIGLYRQKYSSDYPPVIANCPDYWDMSGNNMCRNIKNLGNSSCANIIDFSAPQWSGSNGNCTKAKWAQSCNLSWDGLTENVDTICGV
jgi:hypothetical protein